MKCHECQKEILGKEYCPYCGGAQFENRADRRINWMFLSALAMMRG